MPGDAHHEGVTMNADRLESPASSRIAVVTRRLVVGVLAAGLAGSLIVLSPQPSPAAGGGNATVTPEPTVIVTPEPPVIVTPEPATMVTPTPRPPVVPVPQGGAQTITVLLVPAQSAQSAAAPAKKQQH